MASISKEEADRQRRLVGLLVFGAFAALPYIAVRRRLSTARADLRSANRRLSISIRETEKLRSALATVREETAKQSIALQGDVKALVAEVSRERAQMEEVSKAMEETKRSIGELRLEKEEEATLREEGRQAGAKIHQSLQDLKEAVERLQGTVKRTDQTASEREAMRYQQLSAFLKENHNERNRTYAAALKDVGRSLADIAAFMHEVEVRQGYVPSPDDKRGIERARQLAKKLQELSSTLPSGTNSEIVAQPRTTPLPPKMHEPSDLLSH